MKSNTQTETTMKIQKMVNGKIRLTAANDLDRNRIRFNWGYHDGQSDNRSEAAFAAHFDQVYVAGIRAGKLAKADGTYANDSTAAWNAAGIPDTCSAYKFGPTFHRATKGAFNL